MKGKNYLRKRYRPTNLCVQALLVFFILLLFTPQPATAEEISRFSISGHITDAHTGEDLIGATVYVTETGNGVATNVYGYYSMSLEQGTYTLVVSYVGYTGIQKKITLDRDLTLNFELQPKELVLSEVVVTGEAVNENVTRNQMSTVKIDAKTIRQIPAFMGEVDVIKAIQLLPGVQTISEGSSGFSVRGGSMDQNLIQLDEATVYNASHLLGFFSVFNNDAVKDVQLYKGDIPASAGGRLSSLLDVRMKEGNNKTYSATGGIGTISSRLTLEGPIQKDKSSFIVSGRRTYADLFLLFARNPDLRDNTLYFYDLNGKMNWTVDENNRIYLSGYLGNDIFKNDDFKMGWGNKTTTLRWNHLFSKSLFANISLIHSNFNYSLGVPEGDVNSFEWKAKLIDNGVKADLIHYLNPAMTLRYGASMIHHRFEPGAARGLGEEAFLGEYEVQHSLAWEPGLYIQVDHKISELISLKYGVRASGFILHGPTVVYQFDEEYRKSDSVEYGRGDIISTYYGLEPRLGIVWQVAEDASVKASYSRTRQYIHLAQNSTAGTPLDVWFPSSPNVKPQIADQVATGYFRNFFDNQLEASAEIYYKYIRNAVDFRDHANLLLNKEYEGELRFGTAQAYGLELMARFHLGPVNGWIGYTLSRTERTINGINDNQPYPASYDKPHDVSIVVSYNVNPRLVLGANWVYSTGSAVTFPTGKFDYGGLSAPIFSSRNGYRMPDYHRLDLSATWKPKPDPDRKFFWDLNFSVYNAYARKNPWVINFVQDEDNPNVTYAEMTYLFSIIPAITFNFHY